MQIIEVQVPKDISEYESTLIGPLTSRQTICFAAAAIVEFLYYNAIQMLDIGLDMNALLCIGIMLAAPILYMAIGKPYGMRPETYIYYYLLPMVLSKKDRPYETKLTYDAILDALEIQEPTPNKAKSEPKNKKKKVKSKQDIMYL